ncbi:RNA polymerase sigma factor [Arthrobacter sp. 35W]|uniref:RNA polymerase sigma factor n=1 Tax=Arthrobacter sp. 35W TaxID=1132441 RepID=UPI001E36477B|nr:sigma-70 family RNA polymerase sigma factor [Arthrobacter sp. 35W]
MISGQPDRLRRRSISLGVAPDDAQDVAQTALLRAWRSIDTLQSSEPGQMCAWLDRIARNAAIDLARQQARSSLVPLDESFEDPRSVRREVEIRETLDGALRAIQDLPATLREPLVLSVAERLTAPEIADRLQISAAAARQRISRARKRLLEGREDASPGSAKRS